jgi:hypothetical protein
VAALVAAGRPSRHVGAMQGCGLPMILAICWWIGYGICYNIRKYRAPLVEIPVLQLLHYACTVYGAGGVKNWLHRLLKCSVRGKR